MNERNLDLRTLPPPPRAINALINGFNNIANNIVVILFPAIIDIFLWLGPRLKADALLAPFMAALPELPGRAPDEQVRILTQAITDIYNGFNLFSNLRSYPLGIFSLMSVNISTKSPLGLRPTLDTPNIPAIIGCFLLLTMLGWIGGSFYFHAVARVSLRAKQNINPGRTLLQALLLSVIWMIVFIITATPVVIVLWLITLLDSFLRTIILMLFAIPASWVILGIFFSFHGIYTNAQNSFVSVMSSLRLLRFALPPLGWFAMLALVINQGMDLLWRVPPAESWMTGVGILGHAFVSTGLLAASFIYYQDLLTWIEIAQRAIALQVPPGAAR